MRVREVSGIDEIRDGWIKLLERSETGTVFQTPTWIGVWRRHAASAVSKISRYQDIKSIILGVYEGERLVGVGVFELRGEAIIWGAMWPSWGRTFALSDFGDIVAKRGREEEVWGALLKYFSIRYTVYSIQLDFVREESPSFKILPQVTKDLGYSIKVEPQEVSPAVKIPESWGVYLRMLGRKRRHELKRKMNQVEEVGGRMVIEEKVDSERVTQFVELVRKSSGEKREFMDDEMKRFLAEMMEEMFAAKLARLFGLEARGEIQAMVLGFCFGKGWYLYNGGFNPEFGRSVGISLSGMIVREAIKQKIVVVDFLRGGERYKYDLGARGQQLYRLTLRPAVAGSGQALRPAVAGSGQAIDKV